MEQLASELGISCCHPSRAFRGTFGLKLKKFARHGSDERREFHRPTKMREVCDVVSHPYFFRTLCSRRMRDTPVTTEEVTGLHGLVTGRGPSPGSCGLAADLARRVRRRCLQCDVSDCRDRGDDDN